MLEDFDPTKPIDEALVRRFVIALAIAAGLLGALFGYLIFLSLLMGSRPVAEVETEVTFEEAPPVPEQPEEVPEPEEPQEQNFDPRPAVVREAMQAPTEIPDEVVQESDAELAPSTDVGPQDGNLHGTGRAGTTTGRGLVQAEDEDDEEEAGDREQHYGTDEATAPRLLDGCRVPSFPNDPTLVGQVVRVRCTISVEGAPSCTVLSGPDSARAAALECAQGRTYEPARFPNGVATPYPKSLTFIIGGS